MSKNESVVLVYNAYYDLQSSSSFSSPASLTGINVDLLTIFFYSFSGVNG